MRVFVVKKHLFSDDGVRLRLLITTTVSLLVGLLVVSMEKYFSIVLTWHNHNCVTARTRSSLISDH